MNPRKGVRSAVDHWPLSKATGTRGEFVILGVLVLRCQMRSISHLRFRNVVL
jgi:hypothetical protein